MPNAVLAAEPSLQQAVDDRLRVLREPGVPGAGTHGGVKVFHERGLVLGKFLLAHLPGRGLLHDLPGEERLQRRDHAGLGGRHRAGPGPLQGGLSSGRRRLLRGLREGDEVDLDATSWKKLRLDGEGGRFSACMPPSQCIVRLETTFLKKRKCRYGSENAFSYNEYGIRIRKYMFQVRRLQLSTKQNPLFR